MHLHIQSDVWGWFESSGPDISLPGGLAWFVCGVKEKHPQVLNPFGDQTVLAVVS